MADESVNKLLRKLATTEKVIIGLLAVVGSHSVVEKKLAHMEELISDIPSNLSDVTANWHIKLVGMWAQFAGGNAELACEVTAAATNSNCASRQSASNATSQMPPPSRSTKSTQSEETNSTTTTNNIVWLSPKLNANKRGVSESLDLSLQTLTKFEARNRALSPSPFSRPASSLSSKGNCPRARQVGGGKPPVSSNNKNFDWGSGATKTEASTKSNTNSAPYSPKLSPPSRAPSADPFASGQATIVLTRNGDFDWGLAPSKSPEQAKSFTEAAPALNGQTEAVDDDFDWGGAPLSEQPLSNKPELKSNYSKPSPSTTSNNVAPSFASTKPADPVPSFTSITSIDPFARGRANIKITDGGVDWGADSEPEKSCTDFSAAPAPTKAASAEKRQPCSPNSSSKPSGQIQLDGNFDWGADPTEPSHDAQSKSHVNSAAPFTSNTAQPLPTAPHVNPPFANGQAPATTMTSGGGIDWGAAPTNDSPKAEKSFTESSMAPNDQTETVDDDFDWGGAPLSEPKKNVTVAPTKQAVSFENNKPKPNYSKPSAPSPANSSSNNRPTPIAAKRSEPVESFNDIKSVDPFRFGRAKIMLTDGGVNWGAADESLDTETEQAPVTEPPPPSMAPKKTVDVLCKDLAALEYLIYKMLSQNPPKMQVIENNLIVFSDSISLLPAHQPELINYWSDKAADLLKKYTDLMITKSEELFDDPPVMPKSPKRGSYSALDGLHCTRCFAKGHTSSMCSRHGSKR